MNVFLFINWLKLLIILLPLFLVGFFLIRISSVVKRVELVIPTSIVLGLTFFIFLLNTISHFVKGENAILSAYFITIVFGLFLSTKFRRNDLDFPKGKSLVFWIISLGVWIGFLFWKAAYALVGGDSSIYYSIASSFVRGNYPPVTPWQPDTPLSYHLGTLELLGSINFFTNLSFDFLHRFLSTIFIICSVQIVLWIWKRHNNIFSFILTNLIVASAFISFGFLKFVIPHIPLKLPAISNFKEFILWARDLPTVYDSIETYGAPVTLDSLMYAIFHAHGMAIFFLLLTLIIFPRKDHSIITWIVLLFILATLALVNESIFVAAFPAVVIVKFFLLLKDIRNYSNYAASVKKVITFLLLVLFSAVLVLIQGGVISANMAGDKGIEKSVVVFPKRTDISSDFISYHINSMRSRAHLFKESWLPFNWYHVGVDILFLLSLYFFLKLKFSESEKIILLTLITTSVFALIAYNIIVPKYVTANSNRILAISYQLLALIVGLVLIAKAEKILSSTNLILKSVIFLVIILVYIPTIVPPLAKLSKTRFGPNKMVPDFQQTDESIKWIRENTPVDERAIVLDARAPHPSGDTKALVNGILTPLFIGGFRTYNIDPGPEYIDIVYTLSPKALKDLKISTLLIDQDFFSKMSEVRKKQLDDDTLFKKLFEYIKPDRSWEKVYKVNDLYLQKGGELPGTISELITQIPSNSRVYIDIDENFHPNFLRRPLIFSLRNNELFFVSGSGVYQHVEVPISLYDPQKGILYNYLLLGKASDPHQICFCDTELLWKGLNDKVYLWKNNSASEPSEKGSTL